MPKKRRIAETHPDAESNQIDLISNPWDNVYWFSRMLISTDKYGGVGTDSVTLGSLVGGLRTILKAQSKTDGREFDASLCREFIASCLSARWGKTKRLDRVQLLASDLGRELRDAADVNILIVACEKILIPINNALKFIPNSDRIFGEAIVTSLLKTKGNKALSEVINLWDDLGVKGCLSAERTQIVKGFAEIRKFANESLTDEESAIVLSAFCQEFERRLGQKRKGRAGRGVESVTSLILDYYGIPTVDTPDHFTTGLEIDKWIRTKDGWIIGISCKRTLRERWKQAYTDNLDLLNRHKIKELWHLVAFDADLSDDKLTEMGSYRAKFYLPDESSRLHSAKAHAGMRDYVRPMSRFADDIKSLISAI